MKKCPSEKTYQREKARIAIDYAPDIYCCGKCGYPVIDGYVCNYCGDTNPQEEEQYVLSKSM